MNSTNGSSLSRGLLVVFGIVAVGLMFALAVSATNSSILRTKLKQAEQQLATAGGSSGGGAGPARVASLEKLLADQAAAYARLQDEYAALQRSSTGAPDDEAAADASPNDAAATPALGRDRRNSWLERLKTEDPDQYAQIQKERDERRQRVAEFFDNQLNRLDERYQQAGTEDEASLLANLADTLAQMHELRQQWQAVRELPEDQRRAQAEALGQETRETFQKLAELRAQDRQLQLEQLAGQVGYTDTATTSQFVDEVKRIMDETDTNPMRFMGGGFGRGDRRR